MKLVVIESPFGSKHPDVVEGNLDYLRKCIRDSLTRGEAPYASHGLYPGALDDNIPEQRDLGMCAGFAWGECAEMVAVYIDRGVSPGMIAGIGVAVKRGIPVVYRSLSLGTEWK